MESGEREEKKSTIYLLLTYQYFNYAIFMGKNLAKKNFFFFSYLQPVDVSFLLLHNKLPQK